MKRIKMERLNKLFEKMVANSANNAERFELRVLYQEYIDDGRNVMYNTPSVRASVQMVS